MEAFFTLREELFRKLGGIPPEVNIQSQESTGTLSPIKEGEQVCRMRWTTITGTGWEALLTSEGKETLFHDGVIVLKLTWSIQGSCLMSSEGHTARIDVKDVTQGWTPPLEGGK